MGASEVCANFLRLLELPWPQAVEVFLFQMVGGRHDAQEGRISWEVNYIQEFGDPDRASKWWNNLFWYPKIRSPEEENLDWFPYWHFHYFFKIGSILKVLLSGEKALIQSGYREPGCVEFIRNGVYMASSVTWYCMLSSMIFEEMIRVKRRALVGVVCGQEVWSWPAKCDRISCPTLLLTLTWLALPQMPSLQQQQCGRSGEKRVAQFT